MTDNVAVTPGSGANIATDDIGGVQFQRVKLIHGANGVNDGDVSTANGLPVNVIAGSAAGVQYTEGDIDSTITGTAMLWEDTGDTLTTVSSVTPLPVNITTASNPIGTYSTIGVDDAVFNGGDALWGIGAVRDDALTTLIEVDGDWNPLRTNARGAAWVAIEDGSGGQITSFGGGTQYTEGDTDSTITGTAIMWESGGDTLNVVGTNAPLPTSANIADGTGNGYLSASATMNQSSGSGLFPSVMVGQYDDTSPTVPTENRFANARISKGRELYAHPVKAASGGDANVTAATSNTTLLAANADRKGFSIFNDSTAILYLKFGATASSTSFHVKMDPGGYYESNAGFVYTGVIDGIWAAANGAARVGEFS